MTDDVDWQPGIVFTHTLSLTLDDKAQEILQSIRDQLMAVGVPVLHQPAHITVAAVSTMEGVDSHLVDVGWPERITLTKSCRLPNSDGVVGLCPHDPTSSDPVTIFDTSSEGEPELCSAPPSVGSFRALTCLPEVLRRPRWWSPHVTMGYQVPPELQGRAVRIVAGVGSLEVGVAGVSVWRVGDGHTYRLWP